MPENWKILDLLESGFFVSKLNQNQVTVFVKN